MLPTSPYFVERRYSNPPSHTSLENHSRVPASGLGSPPAQTSQSQNWTRGESCSEHHLCQSSLIHSFMGCSPPGRRTPQPQLPRGPLPTGSVCRARCPCAGVIHQPSFLSRGQETGCPRSGHGWAPPEPPSWACRRGPLPCPQWSSSVSQSPLVRTPVPLDQGHPVTPLT